MFRSAVVEALVGRSRDALVWPRVPRGEDPLRITPPPEGGLAKENLLTHGRALFMSRDYFTASQRHYSAFVSSMSMLASDDGAGRSTPVLAGTLWTLALSLRRTARRSRVYPSPSLSPPPSLSFVPASNSNSSHRSQRTLARSSTTDKTRLVVGFFLSERIQLGLTG